MGAVPHYAAAALCGALLTSARAEHSRVQWPAKGTVSANGPVREQVPVDRVPWQHPSAKHGAPATARVGRKSVSEPVVLDVLRVTPGDSVPAIVSLFDRPMRN